MVNERAWVRNQLGKNKKQKEIISFQQVFNLHPLRDNHRLIPLSYKASHIIQFLSWKNNKNRPIKTYFILLESNL
jgi:hypothetical protein